MKKDIKEKIREAMTKKLREEYEEREFIFEGVEDYEPQTLGEFFKENDREDYLWYESLDEESKNNREIQYKVGDIIMPTRYFVDGSYVENSPHKILVITSKKINDNKIVYQGFLFSSKTHKSNINNKNYPNNIHIKNYKSISYKGNPLDKESFIRVDKLITFTNEDLDVSGSWKGSATWDFMRFVQDCMNNYRSKKDNSSIVWE